MFKVSLSEKKLNLGLLCLFLLVALFLAIKAIHGLILPVEQDDYRDMGIAENMLNGHYLNDPTYLHESLWYNPFLPAVDAFVSRITGLPVRVIVTHIGKFLNLLIPITIYIMANKLFDRKVALATAAACIFFICGNEYGEHTSGYTYIWLAIVFSQVFFYTGITLANKTLQQNKLIYFALLGVLTGFMFLCHSALSFLFCLVLICCFIHALLKKEFTFKEFIIKGLVFSIPFLAVGSPLLYSVFIHYHYKIKNVDPMQWVAYILEPAQLKFLFIETVNVYFLIAVVGFISLIRNKSINRIARRLLLYWTCCSSIVFFYVYSIVILRTKYGIVLPGFVPSCDAFFCVKSAESVLFGIGLYSIANWLFSKWGARLKFNFVPIFYSLLVILVLLRAPGYARRKEFTWQRQQALKAQDVYSPAINAYNWLRQHTGINDVILCKNESLIFPVMASGRKMVVANTYYSSPYISYIDRQRDSDSLIVGLKEHKNIQDLLNKYEVKYLLISAQEQQQFIQAPQYFPITVYNDSFFIIRARQ